MKTTQDAILEKTLEEKWKNIRSILLNANRYQKIRDLAKEMRPNEVAALIQYLDPPLRKKLIKVLKSDMDPDVFVFLDQSVRESIVSMISAHQITSILKVLESDDALSLVSSMKEGQKEKVLNSLPVTARKKIIQGLAYPESSAGRLMQTEILSLPLSWTVKKSLEHIIISDVPDMVSDAFIVDEQNRPVGTVSLLNLIKTDKSLYLKDVMNTDIQTIPDCLDEEEAAFTFRMNDLMIAPVVDANQKLVGMITADDVIDVVNKKATEDLLHMGGVHEDDFYQSATRASISRARWLLITLINTFLTSIVIGRFQDTLANQIALTVFMPVAAAMGGNAGIQSTTIVTRALATKELGKMNMRRFLFKECRIALLSSVYFGIISFLIGFLYFHDIVIAFVLGSSVIFNILWAGILGTVLPVVIQHFGHDPALSASPLLTTTTDVFGYAVFLGLARLLMS
jgi:magnesium transporter